MKITDITTNELKVMAYNALASIENNQAMLKVINQEIGRRLQEQNNQNGSGTESTTEEEGKDSSGGVQTETEEG